MDKKRFRNTMAVLLFAAFVLFKMTDGTPGFFVSAKTENGGHQQQIEPLTVKVILERRYLDGEVSQESFEEKILSMEDFWAKYTGWQLVDMDSSQVVFRENVDDISPLLKANGYFGITEDGTLTIFNGKPDEANVIQSFFQIDVGKLESAKHAELKKGIPIKDREQYVNVLETFQSYTSPKKEAN